MNKKPRIAFCFSWQARTLDQTYLFFQKNLFDAAKEQWFEYNVFCAVEDDEDVDKVNLLNPTKVEKIKSSEVEKIIEEKFWDFIENEMYLYYDFCDLGAKRDLQQFYKVQKSILLVWDDLYDIVMKLRFDMLYINKFNFNAILDVVKSWAIICNDLSHLIETQGLWSTISAKLIYSYFKIEDLTFIWNKKSMSILWTAFDWFEKILRDKNKNNKYRKSIWKILSKLKIKIIEMNKKLFFNIPLTPINLLIKIMWTKMLVWDCYYYLLFLKNGKKIVTTKISRILVRKNIKDSKIRLENKTQFEL